MHLVPHPPTPPPRSLSIFLHNLRFSFLLGLTAVPREIENTADAKFLGGKKVHYGKGGSGVCQYNTGQYNTV